jgi:hypothetical protein
MINVFRCEIFNAISRISRAIIFHEINEIIKNVCDSSGDIVDDDDCESFL